MCRPIRHSDRLQPGARRLSLAGRQVPQAPPVLSHEAAVEHEVAGELHRLGEVRSVLGDEEGHGVVLGDGQHQFQRMQDHGWTDEKEETEYDGDDGGGDPGAAVPVPVGEPLRAALEQDNDQGHVGCNEQQQR